MAQFASDSFTGTSGTELHTYSGSWVKHGSSGTGTFNISNANRCRKSNDSNEAMYYHTGTPASADYTVSADIVHIDESLSGTGVVGRVDTGANTFYMARYYTVTGGWELHKRIAGTFTQLGTTQTQTFTTGTKNVKLSMVGTTIKLYKELSGTATISVTDSDISAAGKSGLRSTPAAQTDTTGKHIDNFSANDVGGGYTMSVSAGSFTLTGNAATLKAARKLAGGTGAFTLTGIGAALKLARKMAASTGAFSLTGNDATLTYTPAGGPTYTLAVGNGAFSITGNDAGLKAGRKMAAGTESFIETGNAAALKAGRKMVAGSGSFTLTGLDAILKAARKLPAGTGVFTLTGSNVNLTVGSAFGYEKNNQLLVDSIGGKVLQLGSTRINTWGTSTRPASPRKGTIGYNIESSALDVYDGSAWKSIILS